MDQKKLFTARIMQLLDEYASGIPDVSSAEMPQPEFAAIVEKWHLSTPFLKKFLGKSDSAVQTYKYRKDHPVTGSVAARIRKLDFMLSALQRRPAK